ncbi:MAG: hypothetical protein Fur0032_21810 [Terrimicrobiaceae bacterium]
MKKADRLEAFIKSLGPSIAATESPCYLGYFVCFNRSQYYEAHDVLEHLWLRSSGPDRQFYKGLIQLAGAFVHLKLHHQFPSHPVHGRRLRPAARLFLISTNHLRPFAPLHHRLDIESAIRLAASFLSQLKSTDFTSNPWHPNRLPELVLLPESQETSGQHSADTGF